MRQKSSAKKHRMFNIMSPLKEEVETQDFDIWEESRQQ